MVDRKDTRIVDVRDMSDTDRMPVGRKATTLKERLLKKIQGSTPAPKADNTYTLDIESTPRLERAKSPEGIGNYNAGIVGDALESSERPSAEELKELRVKALELQRKKLT